MNKNFQTESPETNNTESKLQQTIIVVRTALLNDIKDVHKLQPPAHLSFQTGIIFPIFLGNVPLRPFRRGRQCLAWSCSRLQDTTLEMNCWYSSQSNAFVKRDLLGMLADRRMNVANNIPVIVFIELMAHDGLIIVIVVVVEVIVVVTVIKVIITVMIVINVLISRGRFIINLT